MYKQEVDLCQSNLSTFVLYVKNGFFTLNKSLFTF